MMFTPFRDFSPTALDLHREVFGYDEERPILGSSLGDAYALACSRFIVVDPVCGTIAREDLEVRM